MKTQELSTKELRRGNIITYHDKNIIVSGIVRDVIYYESKELCFDSNIGDYKPFKPIPLTKEWLLKLRFEWDIYYQGYTDGNWVINPNNEKGYRLSYGKRRYDTIVWNIETVHQLQNLYFDLTGEEITI